MYGYEHVAKLLIERGAPITAVDKVCKPVQSVNIVSVQHNICNLGVVLLYKENLGIHVHVFVM